METGIASSKMVGNTDSNTKECQLCDQILRNSAMAEQTIECKGFDLLKPSMRKKISHINLSFLVSLLAV
jgi:hypothetical protein